MDEFNQFTKAHTCKETLLAFRNLRTKLGLEHTSCDKFFDQLGLGLNNWKVKKLFEQIRKRFSLKEYKENRSGDCSKVLVIGAGPCGLRIAIEAAFLGCEVVLIDKRNAFSRNNVLHLWPFVVTDLKNLGIKHFHSRFGCGELDHISIRRLQLSLLKIALIVGVEIHTEVEFKGLRYPKSGSHEEYGWHCVCQPSSHVVSEYKFDVLIAATGARDALCEYDLYNENDKIITKQGFDRKEFRGQLSIAITANFVNENTTEEIKANEIGGVASHFNQKLFNDLKRQKKIHLENFVYYKDETHYFVMTAKKSSLLERGVFKDSCKDKPEELMQKTNVNIDALLDFARDAANFCTHNAMPNLQFAKNSRGAEDVAMLDFSSKFEAVNASRIIERHGHQLLICLVGDSLLEPFWPQGTGCARGFLGAMDSAWMIKNWKEMQGRSLDIIAERESIYKVLSQTNPNDLKKKYSEYTVDPKSRYLSINLTAVGPDKAKQYYDNIDTISEKNQDVVDEAGPPSKRSKSIGDEIDLTDLLTWCQMVLKGYPFFSIKDLTMSWRSGCELGRLIHSYRPELINLKDLDPKNPLKTMSLVVDIAQKQLGIYSVIGISEMVNCSTQNEVEMAAYLFQFYEMFHHEPIPQTGPMQHEDMDVNMNMDTIETPYTERFQKEVQSSDICCICRNELFILEKITVEQNMFCHRTCLKCDTCQCELNLTNYRLKKSTKGNVKFYCSRHARPGSVFKSSVRKRVYPGIRLSNKPKPCGMDNETSIPHVDNKDESLPDRVKDNTRLPERPDFLARTVTSASLRRVDFYNSRDDENDEPEEKIFQHNFGASIRGGRGMFAVVNQEQEMEEKLSSSGDDDIGELVEANIGTDIDKHMTIKEANTFWQTLKRQVVKQNVVKYMETASGGSDKIPQRGGGDVYDWGSTEDKHNDKTGDKVDLSQLQPISDEEDMSADQRDNTQSDNIRRNSDLLENRIEELNRESKELEDRRYKFSATCYRPARKLAAIKEVAGDNKPSKVTLHKRSALKRSNSDQTEVRHAQRVQLAARKLARQRQENAFFLAQEIVRQLEEAEVKLEEVEKEGVEIEKALKEDIKTPEKDKPKLRRRLCSLYSRRQTLLQYEAELRAANEQFITSHIVIQKDADAVLQSISSDDDEEGDYVMIKNPDTLETGLNKQTTPAMAETDITHDATERNKSSSPNMPSTERTNAPPIDRTNRPINRGITGVGEETHVYATGNDSNMPFKEEGNLIDEFQNIGIVPVTDDWECPYCTLINKEEDFYCDVCLAWKCSVCTFVNMPREKKCEMCYNDRPSHHQSEDNRSRESYA